MMIFIKKAFNKKQHLEITKILLHNKIFRFSSPEVAQLIRQHHITSYKMSIIFLYTHRVIAVAKYYNSSVTSIVK